jgi:hypothetical protein
MCGGGDGAKTAILMKEETILSHTVIKLFNGEHVVEI